MNPDQSIPLAHRRKTSTSTALPAQTMSTFIRILEPSAQEFICFSREFRSHHFSEISPLQVALITEITFD